MLWDDVIARRLNFSGESMHSFHSNMVISSPLGPVLVRIIIQQLFYIMFTIHVMPKPYLCSSKVTATNSSLFFFSRSFMLMWTPIKYECKQKSNVNIYFLESLNIFIVWMSYLLYVVVLDFCLLWCWNVLLGGSGTTYVEACHSLQFCQSLTLDHHLLLWVYPFVFFYIFLVLCRCSLLFGNNVMWIG